MLSLLLCLFISTMDAIADPSGDPNPVIVESDGNNKGGNNKAPVDSTKEILESYVEEYKNNPEKIRKDYEGLEEVKEPAIAEHTIHSGSSKQISISSKSIDAETPIYVYIVYYKDGKLVRESVKFERDGNKVIINVPQHILDLNLDHISADIISYKL
jgi:hypothetical protein